MTQKENTCSSTLPAEVPLVIRQINGEAFALQISEQATALEIKSHLCTRHGIAFHTQKLVCGMLPVGDALTVCDLGYPRELTLYRVPFVAEAGQELFIRVQQGDGVGAMAALMAPADPDYTCPNEHRTSMQVACERNLPEIFRELCKAGADTDKCTDGCGPPLALAVLGGHLELVHELVASGADVNKRAGDDGDTPIGKAAFGGNKDMIVALCEHGADVSQPQKGGNTPLCMAIEQNHAHVARVLVEAGADPISAGVNGATPLGRAAFVGSLDAIHMLCEKGADVNTPQQNGDTPLLIACDRNNARAVRAMLKAGAVPDVGNVGCVNGDTPIGRAASRGNAEAVRNLCELGADVNHLQSNEVTPLSLACDRRHVRVAQILGDHGANPNKGIDAPLGIAMYRGYVELVPLLLEMRADVNKARSCGSTPLLIAAKDNHLDLVQTLCEKRANMHQRNDAGYFPLSIAAYQGHVLICGELCSMGADINQQRNGKTPLEIAFDQEHVATHEFLYEAKLKAAAKIKEAENRVHRCQNAGKKKKKRNPTPGRR